MRLHRALILLACFFVPADRRSAAREQWLADLRDAGELGIPNNQSGLAIVAVFAALLMIGIGLLLFRS